MQSRNYDELIDTMNAMDIVDSHEHLGPEKNRMETNPDFATLFSHYCRSDLASAGMTQAEFNTVFGPDVAIEEKWRVFEPYYNLVRDGSYSRAAHIAMEKFYGRSELASLADAEAVTEAIRAANKPGLYRKVLKDACNIKVSIVFGGGMDDAEFFLPVMYAGQHVTVTKESIRSLEDIMGVSCGNLSAYVDATRRRFGQLKEQGMKGIKIDLAYMRDLHFAPRSHAEAEEAFLRIMDEGYGWRHASLGYNELRPLQDYMVHRFCEIAGELEVPVVTHTGLQFSMDHNADDSRPLRLWNLPHRYRKTDFVILHSGFPWLEDAALMAKQYSNVYLDLAWAQLMSPDIATRCLQSWIDLVPMNKVFGFGGDYAVVEKVYGHLVLAKQNIARALATKMDTAGMSMDRAKAWIQAMMWENPKRVYKLEI